MNTSAILSIVQKMEYIRIEKDNKINYFKTQKDIIQNARKLQI